MNGNICVELNGIKVGDRVRVRSKSEIWYDKEWYPKEEKRTEKDCWWADWADKENFEVISKFPDQETEDWYQEHRTKYWKQEFKVGDKVKIRKDSEYFGQFEGVGEIKIIGGDGWIWVKSGDYSNIYKLQDLELVEVEQKEVIVHCPTQELFDKVQKKMLETTEWANGDKFCHGEYWKKNKEKTCLSILKKDRYKIGYDGLEWYKERFSKWKVKFISAEEYLGKVFPYTYTVGGIDASKITVIDFSLRNGSYTPITNPTQFNKPKHNFMSVIKNAFKSKEQKALDHFDIVNGDGGLTPRGREELIDYLWLKDKDLKKDFLVKIVEAYQDATKK